MYTVLDSDNGQKTFPKHVEFYSKNKFENLVYLFGFIIRIYHDTRSSECQIGACFVKEFSSQFYEIRVNRDLPQNTTV